MIGEDHLPLFRRCVSSSADDDDGECDGLPLGALGGGGGGGGGGETRPSTKTVTFKRVMVTIQTVSMIILEVL